MQTESKEQMALQPWAPLSFLPISKKWDSVGYL